jgi:hypothetical protein
MGKSTCNTSPVHRHLQVVDQPSVGSGLGHDLHSGLAGAPGDGGGVLLHGKYVLAARKLHVECVHRGEIGDVASPEHCARLASCRQDCADFLSA